MSIKIGMTGSRNGISENAIKTLLFFLNKNQISEVHHGDCIGADSIFHNIIKDYNKSIKIFVHPPNKSILRAYCDGDFIHKEKSYLIRNKDIVQSSDMILAFPSSKQEVLRSGTWSTIRYTNKIGTKLMIIYPDGTTN